MFQKCYVINSFWIIWVSRYGRFFCLAVPKDNLGKPLFYKIYGMEKIIKKRRRTSFFLPKILVSQCRKISYGNPSVFQRISGIGKLYAIGGRGYYDSTSDDFLSQMGEKQRGQTPLCFWDVLVSNVFWIVGVSRFCQSFLSHSTEKPRRGNLVYRQCSGTEKFLDYKLSWFCWNFLSHVAENHRGRNFLCFKVIAVSNFFV